MRRSGNRILGICLAAILAISSFPVMGYGAESEMPEKGDASDVKDTTSEADSPIASLGESGIMAATPTSLSVSHDLSTGPLTLTASHGDVRVFGSYTGDGTGITAERGYGGTITLDNVFIDPTGFQSTGITLDTSEKVTLDLIGTNILRGQFGGIYSPMVGPDLPNCKLIISGSGKLIVENTWQSLARGGGISPGIMVDDLSINVEVDSVGEIYTSNLVINKPTTVINYEGAGISATNITINAKTTATGYNNNSAAIRCENSLIINAPTYARGIGIAGISIGTEWADAPPATAIISADTTAIGDGGPGFITWSNIVVDNCTLTASGDGGYWDGNYYVINMMMPWWLPCGVIWGYGYQNAIIGSGNVISKGGTTNGGIQAPDYATYDSSTNTVTPRSSFLDSDSGSETSTTVLPSDPATPPTIPTAVVPNGSLPSGLNHDDLEFQSKPLDPETKNALQQEILADPELAAIVTNYPHFANNTEWIDLALIDTKNGNVEVQPSGPITVYLPFPPGRNASNSDFQLLHRTSTGIVVVPYTLTATGIKFTVSSLSPFMLLYKDKSGGTGGGTVVPPSGNTGSNSGGSGRSSGSGSSGGSGGSTDKRVSLEDSFWEKVTQYIKFAKSGEVVDVLLPYYIEEVPQDVLTTLAGKKVTLLLREARGSKEYSMYGGDMQKSKITQAAYRFSDLSGLLKSNESSAVVTSIDDLQNPSTGGDDGYIPIAQVASDTPDTSTSLTDAGNINANPETGGGIVTLYSASRSAASIPPLEAGTSPMSQQDKIVYILLLSFFAIAIILPMIEYSISEKKKKKQR